MSLEEKIEEAQRTWVNECEGDNDLSLSVIADQIRALLPGATEDEVRRQALKAVYPLLRDRKIWVGDEIPNHYLYKRWEGSAEDQIARIDKEWRALGRAPVYGEIAWFIGRYAADVMSTEELLDEAVQCWVAECAEASLDLGFMMSQVRHALRTDSEDAVRLKTLELLRPLMEKGLLRPFRPRGGDIEYWPGTVDEQLTKIDRDWNELKDWPNQSDMPYFIGHRGT